MPVTPTYPGVYIEEIPSGVRTITGVATSITAFVGSAFRGPVNEPVRIQSFAEYERRFGGLRIPSTMSYAVHHYFLHGGADAIIVRLHHPSGPNATDVATASLPAPNNEHLVLVAANPGDWGNELQAIVDYHTADPKNTDLFNLTVQELDPKTGKPHAEEVFRNLSVKADASRYVVKVLEQESPNVRVQAPVPGGRPDESPLDKKVPIPTQFADGKPGLDLDAGDFTGQGMQDAKHGLYALEKVDLFNLLCLPPLARAKDKEIPDTVLVDAAKYCGDRRAMLMVDPRKSWDDPATTLADTGLKALRDQLVAYMANVAVYFPRLQMADPLKDNVTEEFPPCGAVAGIIARTDAQRGVWKAPAGIDAGLTGVRRLSYKLTDGENGQLNPLGVNCLRSFPVSGHVVWGARTLAGADQLASEWKYVPVRRLALFLEESLYRGTQWIVFEPNDEPLWAQIRLNVGAFMHNLFRQGAFQGQTPREAYLVKCDKETTTQNDINLGIVNIVVGFAPLKPAEFVIIKIQQLAGQIQA